jgi:hypothetical protein
MPSYKAKINSTKTLGSDRTVQTCREVVQSRISPQIKKLTQNGMKKKWLNLTNKTHLDSWHADSYYKDKVINNAGWVISRLTEQLLERILPKVGSKRTSKQFMVRVKAGPSVSWNNGGTILTKVVLPGEVLVNPFFISLYLGLITNIITVMQTKGHTLPPKTATFAQLLKTYARSNVWGSPLHGSYSKKIVAFLKTYDVENYHRLFMEQEKTQIYYNRTRGINEWYGSSARKRVEANLLKKDSK